MLRGELAYACSVLGDIFNFPLSSMQAILIFNDKVSFLKFSNMQAV